MAKISVLILAVALGLLPVRSEACRRMGPNDASLDQYSSVFVGHVTSIHLEGYENQLLGRPDLIHPELGPLTITNGASPVSVRVVVAQAIRGSASGGMELRLAGCTSDLPQIKDRGIFFVLPDGAFTVVAWERDGAAYGKWLSRLAAP